MTATLTEGIVLSRTRTSCLQDVTQLNCWGCNLKECKLLERMPNLRVLSVSSNALQTLRDFACCHNLHELYVRNNDLRHLDEIYWLKDLSHLHTLWLDGNPCVASLSASSGDKQRYRDIVLKHIPFLKVLDQTSFTEEDHERVYKISHQLPDYSTSAVILQALSLHEPSAVKSTSTSSSSSSSKPGSCQSFPVQQQQKTKTADQFFIDLNERLQQAAEGSQAGSRKPEAVSGGVGRRAASARQSTRSNRGEKFFLDISASENKIVKDSPGTPASDQTYTARENSSIGATEIVQPDDQFSRDYERLKREYKERQMQQYQQENCRPSSPSMVDLKADNEKLPSSSRESNISTIADFYASEQFEDFVDADKTEAEGLANSHVPAKKERPSFAAASGDKYATFTRNRTFSAAPAVAPNNTMTSSMHKPIMLQGADRPSAAPMQRSNDTSIPAADFTYENFESGDSWPALGNGQTRGQSSNMQQQFPRRQSAAQQNEQQPNGMPPVPPRENKQPQQRRRIHSTGIASVHASPTTTYRPSQPAGSNKQQHQPFQRFQPMYQSMQMGSTQSSPLRRQQHSGGGGVHHQSNGNLSTSTGGGGRRSPWQMTENEYRLRAANVLTAVLSLVRDLDFDSLRIVDQEVRSKMQAAAIAQQQQQQMAAIDSGDDMMTPSSSSALAHDFFGHINGGSNAGHFLDESNA